MARKGISIASSPPRENVNELILGARCAQLTNDNKRHLGIYLDVSTCTTKSSFTLPGENLIPKDF